MAKKIRFWLDSGANIYSRYERTMSTEEIGFTDEEWDALSEDEKEEVAKDVAWERMDWGFLEL